MTKKYLKLNRVNYVIIGLMTGVCLVALSAHGGWSTAHASAAHAEVSSQVDMKALRKGLENLSQLHIDAIFFYRQAAEKVSSDNLEVASFLRHQAEEKENQLKKINGLVIKYHGTPPEYSRDAQGLMMTARTAVQGLTYEGVLKATEANVRKILNGSKDLLRLNVPQDVAKLVAAHQKADKEALDKLGDYITGSITTQDR